MRACSTESVQSVDWATTHALMNNLYKKLYNKACTIISLVPRPLPFFVLRFAFSIIHGIGRARKTGKAWEHLHVNDVRWTRGGRRGAVPDYKYGRNKPESEFLTGQAEYS